MKNKLFSIFTALAMVLGILVSPFTSAHADDGDAAATVDKTTNIYLHKLLMTSKELQDWDSKAIEEKGYDATQNVNQLKALLEKGHSADDIEDVFFAVKNSSGQYIGKDGKALAENLQDPTAKGFKEAVLGGLTVKGTGLDLDVSNLEQNNTEYEIVEIPELTTYKGPQQELLAASKAVPVKITLPITNNDGVVEKAHVYPKNTQEAPKVDKDFKKGNDLNPANLDADKAEIDEIHGGANVEDNQRDKKVATTDLGKKVPYEIKAVIPAKTKYKTLAWDDTMTEGLTFNDDVELKIGGEVATLGTDYIVSYKNNGFAIQLLQSGLDKVYDQAEDKEIYITYSATVNEKAKVDVKEKNNLNFYYDNKVSVKKEPESTNPVDEKLKVTKDFPNVQGGWVEGEEVTVTIIDEETGKPVEFKDGQKATVVLTKDNQTHEWTGLDNNKKYKVVETFKPSDIVTYEKAENGEVIIHDEIKPEDDRPNKITPSVPEVVLGGRKFVKTNNENKDSDKLERLAGAEFYVKNAAGDYLVAAKKDAAKVTTAKKALDDAVTAYNELSAEDQKGDKGTAAKKLINDKQDAYNKAFKENATEYTWGKKDDANVVVLTSDAEGRFEISGLEYKKGYKLEEKTAPKGYAKLQSEEEFDVKEGSYASTANELQYNKDNADKGYGLQIKNKNITIPQTGGIGSLIFVVAGLAIMAGAFVAYKKNQARA